MHTTINNELIDLLFSHSFKSYGHYTISIRVLYGMYSQTIKKTITDAGFIDKINDMKADDASPIEIEKVYYYYIIDDIEEVLSLLVDKWDMLDVMNEANEILEEEIFDYNEDWGNLWNTENRYEGNDFDMKKIYGNYMLTFTGGTYLFGTKAEAVRGLLDFYSLD